ncbi:hypothetical protein R5R35_013322 [Gryllus longicercus]
MKVLNVAEKNDAAKTLAGFMSSNIKRREGFSKFNKIYEFEYMLFGQKCDMIMTSVSGHLLGLEFVGSYRHWRSCNPLSLFDAPVVKQCIPGYEDIKRTLEREIRKCSVLIIWTDCDREGESIGFEVIEVCKAVKPSIKIYRAKFSEITSQSVKRALQNLAQPDKRTNDAVVVRQELDLRIGAAFTRFQTLRLRQVFPQNLSDSLVSYGSCQFPTLGFVVERYKAIESFIPESFWKIKVIHEKNDLCVDFSWKRVRLFDQLACQCFYDLCIENPVATVVSVNSKPKSRWRPLPLDTVELEKVGSRKLKINAKEIMRIAEKLYTQGFISYPRTETNIFPKEINLSNLIGMQTADPAWGEFAGRVLQDGPNPRNGTKSDKAHPPIHPIKYTSGLSGAEQKVYEFVVRRFLACCSKDAQGQETIVEINIADELFVANGLMITARNYLDVYPYDKWSAKEIHVYEVGEQFRPNIEMADGTTSPPKLLTEADLIALMEKHGIGTDATHADHIETIKSRLYVGLENEKFFVPGHLGMGLVEGYDSMGFPMSKPNLRAELEADLVKICEGRKNPEIVLKEQILKYKEVFEVALQQAAKIDEALAIYLQEQPCQVETSGIVIADLPSVVYKCPACGSDMVLRTKRDGSGKFISCMSYPQCKTAVWFPSIVEAVDVSNETCAQCGPNYHKLKFKFRRGALPSYSVPEDTLCIGGCDRDLLEILSINIANVRPSASSSLGNTQSSAINSSASSVNSARGPSSNNTLTDNALFPASDNIHLPGNARNPPQNARGRGRGGQDRGQRSIKDIFQRPGTFSETSVSNARANANPDSFIDQTSDATVMCNCNQAAIQLTVRKDGPNKGRPFYKCGNQSQCNFFQWADSASSASSPPQNSTEWNRRQTGAFSSDSGLGRSANTSSFGQTQFHRNPSHGMASDRFNSVPSNDSFSGTSSSSGTSGSVGPSSVNSTFNSFGRFAMQSNNDTSTPFNESADNAIVCSCNENALLLTVRKEGPNKGRQFYKCGRSTCNFFQWAEESTNNVQENLQNSFSTHNNVNAWQPQHQTGSVPGAANSYDNDVRCRCGGPGKRLMVQKEGPNKGRPFYTCPKSVDKCQFFMWADEGSSDSASGSSSNWGRNNRGGRGGSSSSNSSDGKKKRKCGNCHEEGHTKRSCPNN